MSQVVHVLAHVVQVMGRKGDRATRPSHPFASPGNFAKEAATARASSQQGPQLPGRIRNSARNCPGKSQRGAATARQITKGAATARANSGRGPELPR
ncbi:hypothetical protein GCM10027055_12210 [Janibacter alkaliphilus]